MGITSSRAISLPAIIAGLGGGNAVGTNAVATGATLINSLSTGNATNPNFVIQVGVKTGSGATQATATTALTIVGETLAATFAGALTVTGHATLEGVTSTGATGTGRFVFDASPTLTTPALGVATGTSLALGGATIGTDAVAVTGSMSISAAIKGPDGGGNTPAFAFSSEVTTGMSRATTGVISFQGTGVDIMRVSASILRVGSGVALGWSSAAAGSATDAMFTRAAPASIRLGASAVDTGPVAQTLSVQNVLAGGTSDVAGAAFTIAGSQGKGTGVGGNIIIQTAPAGSTGTTVNALATAATVYGNGDVGIGIGSAIATSATAGFLLIPTCAGTPTGVVANAAAGKAALVYDTTGGILWLSISGSSWKQPKTVGTVLTVAWS